MCVIGEEKICLTFSLGVIFGSHVTLGNYFYFLMREILSCFPESLNAPETNLLFPEGVHIKCFVIQCVKKKLYPLKFKLSASYCINLTALNASN